MKWDDINTLIELEYTNANRVKISKNDDCNACTIASGLPWLEKMLLDRKNPVFRNNLLCFFTYTVKSMIVLTSGRSKPSSRHPHEIKTFIFFSWNCLIISSLSSLLRALW